MADNGNLERLILDMKDSLERELGQVRAAIEDLGRRFDAQAARLDRHGALLQTGSRWSNRMNHWAEKIDRQMDAQAKETAEIKERLDRLERDNGSS
jgi:hypothetical protein